MRNLNKENQAYDELIDYLKSTTQGGYDCISKYFDDAISKIDKSNYPVIPRMGGSFFKGVAIGQGLMSIVLQDPKILIACGISAGTALALYGIAKRSQLKDKILMKNAYVCYLQQLAQTQNGRNVMPFEVGENTTYSEIKKFLDNPSGCDIVDVEFEEISETPQENQCENFDNLTNGR